MCLIMTICAAVVFTLIYIANKRIGSTKKSILNTMFMFWAAAIMWSVDGISSVLGGESFFDISREDTNDHFEKGGLAAAVRPDETDVVGNAVRAAVIDGEFGVVEDAFSDKFVGQSGYFENAHDNLRVFLIQYHFKRIRFGGIRYISAGLQQKAAELPEKIVPEDLPPFRMNNKKTDAPCG